MATGPPLRRTEIRTPMKVLVELCSFENVTYELTYTVDVSAHGARVLTKNPWQSNQHLTVRSVQGNMYSRARVAYCQSPRGSLLCHRRGIASSNKGLDARQKVFALALSSGFCLKPRVDGSDPASKNCSRCTTDGITIGDAEPSHGPFIAKRLS